LQVSTQLSIIVCTLSSDVTSSNPVGGSFGQTKSATIVCIIYDAT